MKITKVIRRYLIAGLLVWVPIGVTILVIKFLIDIIGNSVSLMPHAYRPDNLIGFHIPGINFIFVIIIIFFTGMVTTNYLGNYFLNLWDKVIHRIPLVRTIYGGVKQVLVTIFKPSGQAFRKVLLVEYPRRGMWSVGFQTGPVAKEVQSKTEKEMVTVFIPTTPNPTSGFLMMLPKEEAQELDMSVDEALKFVISLGVVQPGKKKIKTNEVSESS